MCVCVRCICVSVELGVERGVLYLSIDFVCFLFHLPTLCVFAVLALKSRRHCCCFFLLFFLLLLSAFDLQERERERGNCMLRIRRMCMLNSCHWNCSTLNNIIMSGGGEGGAYHHHYDVCYQSSAYGALPYTPPLPLATLSTDLQPTIYFYHNNSLRN